MSINVTGKSVKLWKKERPTRDGGTWNDYSVSVSKKDKDTGEYVNAYIKVRFGRDVVVPNEIPNGASMNFEGYLTPDIYNDKNGNLVKRDMIMITEVSFHDLYGSDHAGVNYSSATDAYDDIADSFSQAEDDIPF